MDMTAHGGKVRKNSVDIHQSAVDGHQLTDGQPAVISPSVINILISQYPPLLQLNSDPILQTRF